MTLQLTNSEISDWRQCRRKHWVLHVLKLTMPPRSEPDPDSALQIGIAGHAAMERWMRDGIKPEMETPRQQAAVDAAGAVMWRAVEDIESIEQAHLKPLDGVPGVSIMGKTDVMLYDTLANGVVPLDYKFSAQPDIRSLRAATQPDHYMTLTKSRHMLLLVIKHYAKRAEATIQRVTRTRAQLDSYAHYLRGWAEDIKAAHDQPAETAPAPNPTRTCGWSSPIASISPDITNTTTANGLTIRHGLTPFDPLARYHEED